MNHSRHHSIHLIGIGGSGMTPLAEICTDLGIPTTGSDTSVGPQIDRLRSRGIEIFTDQNSHNLSTKVQGQAATKPSEQSSTTVIFSSAIPDSNPELLFAREHNMRLMHRSDFLNELLSSKKPITIAGTHGKTTTTALIAHTLSSLGLDPSVYCGAKLTSTQTSGYSGQGEYFVAEIDESDGTFLKFSPFINLITDVGQDHLDYYGHFSNVVESFRKFASNTQKDGSLIVFWDNKDLRNLADHFDGHLITYGTKIGCDVRLFKYDQSGNEATYEAIVHRDRVKGRIKLIGRHNIINTLAALSVARSLELNINSAVEALSDFKGVERRLDTVYEDETHIVLDDFAHNPDKISSCLKGLKDAWPQREICVIFQAHRYSRTENLYNELVRSFTAADLVLVLPIYSAGEQRTQYRNLDGLSADIEHHSQVKSIYCPNFNEAESTCLKRLHSIPSIIITVGAGDVHKIAYSIKKALGSTEPGQQIRT